MSLLNPGLWLALAAAGTLTFCSGDRYGYQRAGVEQQQRDAIASAAAAEQRAQQAEGEREKERLMARSLAAINDQHHQELKHVETQRANFIDGVRSGTIRLSIPVAACLPATGAAGGNPAAVAGDRHQARAELAPETGLDLAAIADDGDDSIRQLNACIDAYNAVRAAQHVQAQ
ncbi:MAG: lysis system i-spanin subunit Rz [Burkholderiaceae bacterium]